MAYVRSLSAELGGDRPPAPHRAVVFVLTYFAWHGALGASTLLHTAGAVGSLKLGSFTPGIGLQVLSRGTVMFLWAVYPAPQSWGTQQANRPAPGRRAALAIRAS